MIPPKRAMVGREAGGRNVKVIIDSRKGLYTVSMAEEH
jgi:hypothetical protein